MKYLIISGNPKQDGLCHSVTMEVARGAEDGGAQVEILTLKGIGNCKMCGDGWGTCREQCACQFGGDGFDVAREKVSAAYFLCLITPVYWGESSEGLISFMDRLRRCDFRKKEALADKQVLLIACPGGSGNGSLTCLEQMDHFCRPIGAVVFDYISVNRWNSDYKRVAAYSAAKAMAQQRKAGETI